MSFIVHSQAAISMAGRRAENEDRLGQFHFTGGQVFLLADGLGGHRGGALAAERIIASFPSRYRGLEGLPLAESIAETARLVNQEVYDLGHGIDSNMAGMAATLVVAAIRLTPDPELIVANAGDSRAYLWRDGVLQRLTKDHTVAAQLAERGLLDSDLAGAHPEAHVLTRSLGLTLDFSLEFANPLSLRDGDGVLLCSDGLCGTLADWEIAQTLADTADTQLAVEKLTQLATQNGSTDNISVQYLKVAEDRRQLEPGSRAGSYILERKLGQGGMGEVWLGRHQELHSLDAIKFILPELSGDAEMRARFLFEGQRQKNLKHAAIVQVLGYGETADGRAYLVLDYIDGESLKARIERACSEAIAMPEFERVALRILDAIEYLHQEKLIHRDIKSSNVLLDRHGQAYLGDFGLIRTLESSGSTRSRAVLGTPEYLSPEQIRSPRDIDSRSDIYSFGCLLYEMLTGKTPFAGLDDLDMRVAHLRHPPSRLRTLNREIPQELERVVLRALEKKPSERWQSCGDIREALKKALAGKPAVNWAWKMRRFLRTNRLALNSIPIILTVFAAMGWWWVTARDRDMSLARRLAKTAAGEDIKENYTAAALVSLESLRVQPGHEAYRSLIEGLGGLNFWDGEPKELVHVLPERVPGTYRLLWSEDGLRLVTVGTETQAWNVNANSLLWKVPGSWVVSPSGNHLVTVGSDETVRIGDGKTGELLRTFQTKRSGRPLAWTPDDRYILWGSLSVLNRVQAYIELRDSTTDSTFSHFQALLFPPVWVPNGSQFAVNTPGSIEIRRSSDARYLKSFANLNGPAGSIAWSPDGRRIAASGADGRDALEVWDAATGRHISAMHGVRRRPGQLAWDPESRLIASGSNGDAFYIWDGETANLLAQVRQPERVSAVAWDRGSGRLATASEEGTVKIWNFNREYLVKFACSHLSRNLTRDEWAALIPELPYHKTCPGLPESHAILYRDVTVNYRATGLDEFRRLRFYSAFGGQKMRFDLQGGKTPPDHSILIDRDLNVQVRMIAGEESKPYIYFDARNARLPIPLKLDDAHFTAAGNERILGRDCARWHVRQQGTEVTICTAEDNVPLHITGKDPAGHDLDVEAISIEYGTPPDWVFQPLADGLSSLHGKPQGPAEASGCQSWSVYAERRAIPVVGLAKDLSPLVQKSLTDLGIQFNPDLDIRKSPFSWLARKITTERADKVRALRIPGIGVVCDQEDR